MEIIDGLEVTRRGLYGGVVGYFDFAGNSDVAIAIRTAVIKDGAAYVQAGAGIVADSVPATEDAETPNKARVAGVARRAEAASRAWAACTPDPGRRVLDPPRRSGWWCGGAGAGSSGSGLRAPEPSRRGKAPWS